MTEWSGIFLQLLWIGWGLTVIGTERRCDAFQAPTTHSHLTMALWEASNQVGEFVKLTPSRLTSVHYPPKAYWQWSPHMKTMGS